MRGLFINCEAIGVLFVDIKLLLWGFFKGAARPRGSGLLWPRGPGTQKPGAMIYTGLLRLRLSSERTLCPSRVVKPS